MLLFEIGDSNFKTYVSKTPQQHTYTFVTDNDTRITLNFHQIRDFSGPPLYLKVEGKEGVGIDFQNDSQKGSEELTGSGDQFKILGAVNKIVRDFIQEQKPPLIMFGAHEPSRQTLYDRWSKMIARDFGYEIDDIGNHSDYAAILGDTKYYVLKKK